MFVRGDGFDEEVAFAFSPPVPFPVACIVQRVSQKFFLCRGICPTEAVNSCRTPSRPLFSFGRQSYAVAGYPSTRFGT